VCHHLTAWGTSNYKEVVRCELKIGEQIYEVLEQAVAVGDLPLQPGVVRRIPQSTDSVSNLNDLKMGFAVSFLYSAWEKTALMSTDNSVVLVLKCAPSLTMREAIAKAQFF
jgi:hypothetical protein